MHCTKAGISIQISQYVANHFVGVFLTELASIPASVFNPLTLPCFSSLLPYSASIFWIVLCLSLLWSGRPRLAFDKTYRICVAYHTAKAEFDGGISDGCTKILKIWKFPKFVPKFRPVLFPNSFPNLQFRFFYFGARLRIT